MKRILFAAIALSSVFFTACEPEEEKIDISYEKALMNRRWQLVDMTQNPNINEPSNTWWPLYSSLDPCVVDNRLIFTSKSTAILDEHFRLCTPSDPQITEFDYFFENEEVIKIYPKGANPEGPYWRHGKFTWLGGSINKFSIEQYTYNETTPDVVVSTIYTYQEVEN